VWMVSSNFRTRVVDELREPDQLPPWLAARGRDDLAARVARPLEDLTRAPSLGPLSSDDLRDMFTAIVQVHGAALRWQPPLDGPALLARVRSQVPEHDAKVRQLVRAAVQYLDLLHQYGVEPRLRLRSVAEASFTPGEDDLPEDAAVERNWPDD
jgi:hypothetical protein